MGSCVSHCSRQDVVHQQTGRVITDVQKSIELTSDTTLQKSLSGVRTDVKDLSAGDNVTRNKSVLSSVKLLTPDTRDVRDQINAEIRALREQLVRSQVLFSYLLKNSSTESTKSPDGKKELCTLLEGGALGDAMFQCKSFDGQALARLYNRSNRSSSSYTSHRSTPLHCGYTSLSCPTLPIDYPVITKSTQTEPLCGASLYVDHSNADRIVTSDSTHSLNKGTLFFSPPSTPCGTIPETYLLSEICEIHQEPEDHSFPRHRTNSFLSAVKEGNPKLVDVENEKGQTGMKQTPSDMHESVQKMDRLSSASCNLPSTSRVYDAEEKLFSEDTKECVYPRKLSILLEEDYEDSSGNFFSVSSSQPFLSRKKKISQSCNAKTQTDLSMSNNPSVSHKKILSTSKTSDLPITETCYPRCGFSIVSQAVQKRTVFSVELPKKLVLRYPPPYTKKGMKCRTYVTYGESGFHELFMKPKTQICKWATVGDSLACKSESSHNLTPCSQSSRLQTRHLSLEKQESFSSCDHSLYPDSHMSSVTDCSGWITKSDVELNLRPEPPSYQQSILSSQRSQFSKNSKIDVSALEQKLIAERGASVTPTKGVLERAKSDGDAKLIDEKNGASKSSKYSQRSLRRGSGAGSPNSLLTIPRCPAFDFSEQEDVHSIFPPLSEPESYSSFKTESYQGVLKSDDAADKEYSQNTLRLKDTSHKKRDASKSKSLMPEFMENSETESTKGSFECEALELPSNTEAPSIPVPDIAFPSLPNTFLAKLGVHKDSPLPVEAFDEQDLESKFIALSLAFKTDRSTLNKRLELHKRQRDMAEKNVDNEFQSMRDHLSALNLKATNSDIRDLISKIQNHLDIAQQATSRVSGRSETYGAVQQEERVSRAFEVLVLHVDHLKRLFDKEHKELEETKRMLTDTRVFKKDFTADIVTEDQKKYSKTFGLPVSSIKSLRKPIVQISES